jgi:hypothetical protein
MIETPEELDQGPRLLFPDDCLSGLQMTLEQASAEDKELSCLIPVLCKASGRLRLVGVIGG